MLHFFKSRYPRSEIQVLLNTRFALDFHYEQHIRCTMNIDRMDGMSALTFVHSRF